MSVMTRLPSQGGLGDLGRPGQPQAMPDPLALQRQAVVSQLAPSAPTTPLATQPGQSSTAFNRGGQVKQLPGMGADTTNKLVGTGASVATTVAGGFNPVSIGTDYLGKKLKPKEEMPTFGGEFGGLTDDYGRRFEGTGPGIKGGAVRGAGYGAIAGPVGAGIGAGIGAIVGAATKNAPSAFSDFRVEDAAEAIGKQFEQAYGRPATEQEITEALVGQGWDPTGGDRWVGEKNLNSVLGSIKANGATEQAQRQALMSQLGTGAPAPRERGRTIASAGDGRRLGPSGSGNAALDATVQELTPEQAKVLTDWNNGAEGRRGAFRAETAGLEGTGWDGRAETRGSDVLGDQEAERARVFEAAGIRMPGATAAGEQTADTSVPAGATRETGGGAVGGGQPGVGKTEGFDSTKFGKNDPKYVFQRIASGISNTDPDRSAKILAALKADPSGFFANATMDGDKLHTNSTDPIYNGITDFDIQRDEENGGGFHWEPIGGGGSASGAAPATTAAGSPTEIDAGRAWNDEPLTKDRLAQMQAELQRIMAGQPPREQLLAQLGAGNG